jgi:hypothetical protein
MLPPDSALPTTLAITATETDGGKDAKVESQVGLLFFQLHGVLKLDVFYLFSWLNCFCGLQLAVPSDLGFHDDEQEEYELLDALESGEVKL